MCFENFCVVRSCSVLFYTATQQQRRGERRDTDTATRRRGDGEEGDRREGRASSARILSRLAKRVVALRRRSLRRFTGSFVGGASPLPTPHSCPPPHPLPRCLLRGLVEVSENLSTGMLADGLMVVQDAVRGRQHKVPELTRRQNVRRPALHVVQSKIKAAWRHTEMAGG